MIRQQKNQLQPANSLKKLALAIESPKNLFIGLMSGTSLDGLDIALVEFTKADRLYPSKNVMPSSLTKESLNLLAFKSYPYSAKLRKIILNTMQARVSNLADLNYELGSLYLKKVKQFIKEHNLSLKEITAIAMHGQTMHHNHRKSTLQIAEADFLSKHLNIPVFFDFRSADVVLNGSGAPLVCYLDLFLAKTKPKIYAFQNLGGIGNVSFADPFKNKITAFDTGPANMMSNLFVQIATNGKQMLDKNAKLAKQGRIDNKLLEYMSQHPFIEKSPPKSAGHEDFGLQYCQILINKFKHLKINDFIRTALKFSAFSIYLAYKKYAPENIDIILLSGGGVKNEILVTDIKKNFQSVPVELFSKEFAIQDQAKEAVCFALLGWKRLHAMPTNFPQVTGSLRYTSLGKLALAD